jgi:hypothetical protein
MDFVGVKRKHDKDLVCVVTRFVDPKDVHIVSRKSGLWMASSVSVDLSKVGKEVRENAPPPAYVLRARELYIASFWCALVAGFADLLDRKTLHAALLPFLIFGGAVGIGTYWVSARLLRRKQWARVLVLASGAIGAVLVTLLTLTVLHSGLRERTFFAGVSICVWFLVGLFSINAALRLASKESVNWFDNIRAHTKLADVFGCYDKKVTMQCTITRPDYNSLISHIAVRYYKSGWYIFAVWVVFASALGFSLTSYSDLKDCRFGFPLLALLVTIILYYGYGRFTLSVFSPTQGQISLEVSEEGVTETNCDGRIFTKATAICSIDETDQYVFIITSSGSGYVVPKRDLKTQWPRRV